MGAFRLFGNGPVTVTGSSYPVPPRIFADQNRFYVSSPQPAYPNTTITIHRVITKNSDLIHNNNHITITININGTQFEKGDLRPIRGPVMCQYSVIRKNLGFLSIESAKCQMALTPSCASTDAKRQYSCVFVRAAAVTANRPPRPRSNSRFRTRSFR
jgi:hypothetical protein